MSSKNIYDLHEDRLQTTDERGHRVYVHPEDLKGKWRTRRAIFYWFLIAISMVLPWIHIKGEQSVLLNILERKFIFFGYTFWGHDAPYLIFILLGFAFSIAFITSLWGRVWCGWACPQTVFLDTIFRKIEQWIEGKSRKRIKLEQAPWSFEKILKKSAKWFLFLLVSLHMTHSFLGYFVGARELFWITTSSPSENWGLFITMLIINTIILFDFGWFREQFCIIMCPYGRFQSILMDSDSLLIAYDEKRGEPRKGLADDHPKGDCVNCYQCVKVCPTGIDIRRGSQLECIACTACIDACDNIMERLNKPIGLIRYTSENELAEKNEAKKLKPRVLIYGLVLFVLTILSVFSLKHSHDLKILLLKAGRTPFTTQELKGEKIIVNHYKVEFFYKGEEHRLIEIETPAQKKRGEASLVTPQNPLMVKKGRKQVAHIFLKVPKQHFKQGSYPLSILFKENNQIIQKKELNLVGPY